MQCEAVEKYLEDLWDTSGSLRDLQAVEVLVSMKSKWKDGSLQHVEPRPLTPSSDSCEESFCSGPADFQESALVSTFALQV